MLLIMKLVSMNQKLVLSLINNPIADTSPFTYLTDLKKAALEKIAVAYCWIPKSAMQFLAVEYFGYRVLGISSNYISTSFAALLIILFLILGLLIHSLLTFPSFQFLSSWSMVRFLLWFTFCVLFGWKVEDKKNCQIILNLFC